MSTFQCWNFMNGIQRMKEINFNFALIYPFSLILVYDSFVQNKNFTWRLGYILCLWHVASIKYATIIIHWSWTWIVIMHKYDKTRKKWHIFFNDSSWQKLRNSWIIEVSRIIVASSTAINTIYLVSHHLVFRELFYPTKILGKWNFVCN